ncbi:MAG: DUF4010 domain-containing protein [Steroidobacteraceae bacterium]
MLRTMNPEVSLPGLASAIGLGLLIGAVRERAEPAPGHAVAGIRTHVMVAVAGALGAVLGTAVLVTVIALLGALVVASHMKSAARDPGLTGEVALPTTALLAALAQWHPALAAGLSVLVASVLFAKRPLHELVRERVSEQELQDALLLAGAALVVLPLLPDEPVDPWGVLVPERLWRIVVLILAMGMAGHIALRLIGARRGLPLAGFLGGFASSTAAVAGFGQRARVEAQHVAAAASAALFANLGSLVLLAAVVGAAAPALLRSAAGLLAAAAIALTAAAVLGLRAAEPIESLPQNKAPRAFRLSHALLLAALMALLLLVSAWLHRQFGAAGALLAAAAAALVEVHAATASIAQLAATDEMPLAEARWGLVLLLVTSTVAKSALAFASGGRRYGWRVTWGLILMSIAAAVGNIFLNIKL